ncbi:hypothetical protein GCM10022221_22740 [Actinocorallia aurea]
MLSSSTKRKNSKKKRSHDGGDGGDAGGGGGSSLSDRSSSALSRSDSSDDDGGDVGSTAKKARTDGDDDGVSPMDTTGSFSGSSGSGRTSPTSGSNSPSRPATKQDRVANNPQAPRTSGVTQAARRVASGDGGSGPDGADASADGQDGADQDGTGPQSGKRITLVPYVKLANGLIKAVKFGRERTPSPFKSAMGDHTSSWASVVDGMHAMVFGKSVGDAVNVLEARQNAAKAWMSDPASDGQRLFEALPDEEQDYRRPLLEHYATRVNELLTQARAELASGSVVDGLSAETRAADLLADAMSHSLAYGNFLPNATVRAADDTGSSGSGEGSARANVVAYERQRETEISRAEQRGERRDPSLRVALGLKNPSAALNGELWKLFSMEAAIRAADLERVVAPQAAKEKAARMRELEKVAQDLAAAIPHFLVPAKSAQSPGAPAAKRTAALPKLPSGTDTLTLRLLRLPTAAGPRPAAGTVRLDQLHLVSGRVQQVADAAKLYTADYVANERGDHRAIVALEQAIAEAARQLSSLMGKVKPSESDNLEKAKAALASASANVLAKAAYLEEDPSATRELPALMLGHLLHEFQNNVAGSYPETAAKAAFLGDDAAKAATQALTEGLRQAGFRKLDDAEVRNLADGIEAVHTRLGPVKLAADARWIMDADTDGLLVAFRDGELAIQGRPAAPVGITGMGAHTTSWVTEVMAVEQLLKEHKRSGIKAELDKEVKKDLKGPLIRDLAALLPSAQLQGGQLNAVFAAAQRALEADTAEESIQAYLSFRNLLPFATVAAGSPDGKGEGRNASKNANYDAGAIEAVITLKNDEYKAENLRKTADRLNGAATALSTALSAPADIAPDGTTAKTWRDRPEIDDAVRKTIAALRAEAGELEQARTTKTNIAADSHTDKIRTVRRTAHNAVWNMGHP